MNPQANVNAIQAGVLKTARMSVGLVIGGCGVVALINAVRQPPKAPASWNLNK